MLSESDNRTYNFKLSNPTNSRKGLNDARTGVYSNYQPSSLFKIEAGTNHYKFL